MLFFNFLLWLSLVMVTVDRDVCMGMCLRARKEAGPAGCRMLSLRNMHKGSCLF